MNLLIETSESQGNASGNDNSTKQFFLLFFCFVLCLCLECNSVYTDFQLNLDLGVDQEVLNEKKISNIRYCMTLARKLGAVLFMHEELSVLFF